MATVNLGRIKFVWQGAYSGATAYVADDVVSYNGSSYICILASTNNLPTNATYWSIMSSAGTNGTNGTDVGTTITTQGDILYRNASGLARLGAGTSGQFLKTNGSGANPAWSTVVSGVVQLKFIEKADVQSWSTTAKQEVTGLNVSITPTSASNKILVLGQIWTSSDIATITGYTSLERNIAGGGYAVVGNHAHANSGTHTNASGHSGPFNGTWNLIGTSVSFLDNPNTTSVVNYKWFVKSEGSSPTYVNRTGRDASVDHPRAVSTITAMEISSGIL